MDPDTYNKAPPDTVVLLGNVEVWYTQKGRYGYAV